MDFQKELEQLINKCSKENGSDTPDFILAEYLNGCLENFNSAVNKRDVWQSRQQKDWAENLMPIKRQKP